MSGGRAAGARFATALLAALALAAPWPSHAAGVQLPDPAIDDMPAPGKSATVVLAGGCFWGIEEVFQHVKGVTDAVSGYSGGSKRTAHYEDVETGTTGHAESVRVTYDPKTITLGRLLKVFFSVAHDPTQRDRQGPDVGPQYRSVIFYASERQQEIARAYIEQLHAANAFRSPIATQVVPLAGFYEAEPEHQDYAARNPQSRYILLIDKPKIDDLRDRFPALYVK